MSAWSSTVDVQRRIQAAGLRTRRTTAGWADVRVRSDIRRGECWGVNIIVCNTQRVAEAADRLVANGFSVKIIMDGGKAKFALINHLYDESKAALKVEQVDDLRAREAEMRAYIASL